MGLRQVQLDFQLPIRFNLSYSTEDEAKREKPVIIHRAILGSVERMFAILLEHYAGKWPFWLSPRQCIVCPVSEKFTHYAVEVRSCIISPGIKMIISLVMKFVFWQFDNNHRRRTHRCDF